MLTTILTSIICSSICSFLIGRIYLNRLYASSNSGHRQAAIILATKEILADAGEKRTVFSNALLKRHRHSLGALLQRMLHAYGVEDVPATMAPRLTNEGDIDIWSFYEENIRPVKEDMNNNSFIGWLSFVHNVKLMTTLWDICHISEDIITNIAVIEAISVERNLPLPYTLQNELLELSSLAENDYGHYFTQLKQQYDQLQHKWRRWLKLNELEASEIALPAAKINFR